MTLGEYANHLIDDHGIIDSIIKDVQVYEDKVNELFKKGTINEKNIDTVEVFPEEPFTHRNNVFIRLNLIR